MARLVSDLQADIVASRQGGTIDVTGVAVPTLVEILLIGIGDVLDATVDLEGDVLVDGEVVGQLHIYLHKPRGMDRYRFFHTRTGRMAYEHAARIVAREGGRETLDGGEGSREIAVGVGGAHHLLPQFGIK